MDDSHTLIELRATLAAISRSHPMVEFDMEGAILFANTQFLEIFGYTLQEVQGRHHSMLVPFEAKLSDDYIAFWDGLQSGRHVSGEYKRVGKSRKEVWIHATYTPVLNETGKPFKVIKYISDITKSKLLSADYAGQIGAIAKSQAVIEFDLDGYILSANQIFLDIIGYDFEDIMGHHHRMFVDPIEVKAIGYEKFWSELRIGRHQSGEFRRLKQSGEEVWLQAYYTPISDLNGRPFKIVKYAADVSETIRRRQSEAKLESAKTAAEATALAKTEFLATMSHELRTPLTSIIGFARLLKENTTFQETEKHYAEVIHGASQTLLQVVNDILDFSKLEAGAMAMLSEPFSPRQLVTDVVALLEPQATAKGLSIICEIGSDTTLLGDSTRLRQVLINLIGNAIKFTSTGHVNLKVNYSHMDQARHLLQIEVQDTGIGIRAGDIARLFERFTQADASTSRQFGGTGLGLAISRQIIEQMGGEIFAESDGVTGSTFHLSIPLELGQLSLLSAADSESALGLERRVKILFADDNAANRTLVAALLTPFNIQLETVDNGQDAVSAALEFAYDMILMDVQMPVMDGPAAAAAIRSNGVKTPILALSANILPEQIESYIAAGMQGHVAKPIDLQQLLCAISEQCSVESEDRKTA